MKEYIFKVLISLLCVISPIQEAIFSVGFLIFVDLILGLTASFKNEIKFSSIRLKNTAVKLLVYNLLLIASFISEKYLVEWIPFTKICSSFLVMIEITSIGENFQKITGISFIKYIKKYINDYLKKGK